MQRGGAPASLSTLLAQPGYQSRFTEVLKHRAPQFLSSVIQVGRSLGDDCDALTIISGAMTAASLDLPINKNLGFAWLVPYKERGIKKAQFQMGYKGYIQLALRTGQYRRMNAGPINKECLGSYDSVGERVVDFSKFDPYKEAAAYFFAFEMVNGFVKMAVWDKRDVEAHAKRYSQSYRGGFDSPWKTNFDEMATKTVISNELRQWGILSVEMQQAMERDGAIVAGIDEPVVSFPDEPVKMVEAEQQPIDAGPGKPDPDDGDLGPQKPAENVAPIPQKPAAPQKPTPEAKAKAPVKPEPQKQPEPAAPPPEKEGDPIQLDPKSSQGQLAAMVTGEGYTWDQFAFWADEVGVIPDCKSLSGFQDLNGPLASRIMRSKGGLLDGLSEVKEKGIE